MTNIVLCGCCGKMGSAVSELVAERNDCNIVAGIDIIQKSLSFPVYKELSAVNEAADIVLDFSHPSSLPSIVSFCRENQTAAVLCTTGYDSDQVRLINEISEDVPVFYSRNMSLGITLLIDLAKKASLVLGDGFDIEIVEMHHNQKIDAPSGTALMIADAINSIQTDDMRYEYDRHSQRRKRDRDEIGISSVRGGTIVGEHQVLFAGRHELLTISHSAQSKELFAVGAVNAAIFMKNKKVGLYDMSDLI